LNKAKTKASHHSPHGVQFLTDWGSEDEDIDDGSTGELEGVFNGRPVLLSKFQELPTKGILDDMLIDSAMPVQLDNIEEPETAPTSNETLTSAQ